MTGQPLSIPQQVTAMIDPGLRPYRVLVTGPRDYTSPLTVESCLWFAFGEATALRRRMVVVHGQCPTGVDKTADTWITEQAELGYLVDVERHPAQGHRTQDFGPWPGAGPERNRFMVSLGADVCYAFLKECSKLSCKRPRPHDTHGTSHCAGTARAAGINVREIRIPQ